MTATGEPHVLLDTRGRAGFITLNRPKAINALTHAMVRRIDEALTVWEDDPAVETIVITGAGERGLCAGGDIRAIHDDARGGGSASVGFWRDEYRLNARIARYGKPYVAFMDGIVMGGGVGVSAHGSVRVVTERSRVAMPETGIGFVPDVGGTYLLSRAPGELGTHLALTGTPVGAADALLAGLADHYVPSAGLSGLASELTLSPAHEALPRYARPAPAGALADHRDWIDACYAADTVESIIDRLQDSGRTEAKAAADTLQSRSPLALKVTLAALRHARTLDSLESVLDMELRLSCSALRSRDLVEGIRAQVIDKDRSPRWFPPTLTEVTDEVVARYLAGPRDQARRPERAT
ncbi:enoyl-CoA hydratase/isomerase family protein [Streptomyces sp. NBC_01216]|uniref:enoyl-CoA hydratase/isomerase family protein n=1 Tax=unclassified Streptomyces TaxID=2593676 RepID=UPI002E0E418C|nr:enoyl-CoA hydratase/isomerase family protein [Streptomyces sp. NBC_01216]